MYKLLIAEDEEIFRKVLPSIIDWNSIGFEIIGVVEDGFEALKLLEQVEVDVILTDIRMPHINGLELAMEVKSRFPRIKTILLSAFNEFEYARKGIDCGVYGYLLKSDDEESIEKYFVKLSKVLSQENLIGKNDESLWVIEKRF
jgi:two-component system response regulator YesN